MGTEGSFHVNCCYQFSTNWYLSFKSFVSFLCMRLLSASFGKCHMQHYFQGRPFSVGHGAVRVLEVLSSC